jgi:SHS2 domain-containing protein
MYELFGHTADLGLRVHAATREELFVDAAHGLIRMLVANPEAVRPVQEKPIALVGTDVELLLFDWLSELLYLFETQHLLLAEIVVAFDDAGLRATCRGEKADPARHVLEHEVKAITYHGLCVAQRADGWFAEVIVDI